MNPWKSIKKGFRELGKKARRLFNPNIKHEVDQALQKKEYPVMRYKHASKGYRFGTAQKAFNPYSTLSVWKDLDRGFAAEGKYKIPHGTFVVVFFPSGEIHGIMFRKPFPSEPEYNMPWFITNKVVNARRKFFDTIPDREPLEAPSNLN